ncbi:MAG: hypothetical protein J07HQW2_02584 [Haloquadratum walsbyi J07HQW2]|jgi:hypothetical protein|uniref:DUF8134 domain-containing protein n=1 Tax=Haloquadratum walsbyi J07HQW2 TaxID=1238425 RepID=U1NG69_9EURY|nr:MAG: hypothetical protein J07HQW2_02584 [Haloquadratum walsbyi J07HQW2]
MSVTVRLRVLDDGAWISVNDQRKVSVSELWRVSAADFCSCELVDFVVENFQAVSVNGRTIEVIVYGQCIACGATGETEWLPVGRIIDGEFTVFDQSAVRHTYESGNPEINSG